MSWRWHGQPPPYGLPPRHLPHVPPPAPFATPNMGPPPPFPHQPPLHPHFNAPINFPHVSHHPVYPPVPLGHPSHPQGYALQQQIPPQRHQLQNPLYRRRPTAPHTQFNQTPPQKVSKPPHAATNKPEGKKTSADVSKRDVVTSQTVLSRLGASLPGNSQTEIEKWIAERRKNWPSRANVARKLAEQENQRKAGHVLPPVRPPRQNPSAKGANHSAEPQNSLAKLAQDYDSSAEEGEVRASDENQQKDDVADGDLRAGRKRKGKSGSGGQNKARKRRKRNGKHNESRPPRSFRPSLMRSGLRVMLLQKEIQQEQSVLLQAFRYIIQKKAAEQQ